MKQQLLALLILAFGGVSSAAAADDISLGQTLYLPVYSHVWHGDRVISGKYPLKISRFCAHQHTQHQSQDPHQSHFGTLLQH